MSQAFSDFASDCRQLTEAFLTEQLQGLSLADNPLHQAMAYSLLGGGKRIRATLVYASAQALGLEALKTPALNDLAAALEAIHAYSLIHDDLPAMDDDDLRRGKPSCHIAFGEATAILAGDALQSLAFEWLAEAPELSADTRIILVQHLAKASGMSGMVLGQAIDLAAVNQTPGSGPRTSSRTCP